MRYVLMSTVLVAASACSPFYSVEQSDVERGYRWVGRGDYPQAISSFETTILDYPQSALAHLGLADALAEARREREAVAAYTKAMTLLRANGVSAPADGGQTVGKRPFSYQNQGLRFPHGVQAYVYYRRAWSFEALAQKDPARRDDDLAAARSDYAAARDLAPDWPQPGVRLACLTAPPAAHCVK